MNYCLNVSYFNNIEDSIKFFLCKNHLKVRRLDTLCLRGYESVYCHSIYPS
jgi:hypothetical protein